MMIYSGLMTPWPSLYPKSLTLESFLSYFVCAPPSLTNQATVKPPATPAAVDHLAFHFVPHICSHQVFDALFATPSVIAGNCPSSPLSLLAAGLAAPLPILHPPSPSCFLAPPRLLPLARIFDFSGVCLIWSSGLSCLYDQPISSSFYFSLCLPILHLTLAMALSRTTVLAFMVSRSPLCLIRRFFQDMNQAQLSGPINTRLTRLDSAALR